MRPNPKQVPNPEQIGDEFVLTDSGDKLSTHLPWIAAGLVFVALGVLASISGAILTSWIPIGVGVFIVWKGFAAKRGIGRLAPGELVLPTWPLRLGEATRLTYRRRYRRGVTRGTDQIERVQAFLVLREVAQRRVGSDTHTAEHEVARYPVDASLSVGLEAIDADLRFEAPPNSPPSFHGHHNWIEWWIEAHPTIGGRDADPSQFKLVVVP